MDRPANFRCKIKCRIKTFFHSYDNFHLACSTCHKKICSCNCKKILLYFFYLTVRDASGVVSICFHDKSARQLMGISPEKYKEFLEDNRPEGKIILSEYIKDFYINEYLFTLEFLEPTKNGIKKKYNVVGVEKVAKSHYHQLVKKIKNHLNIIQ